MPEYIQVELPKQLDNYQLPDPSLATYWSNAIQHRTFWIDDDIDAAILEITRNIIAINREDKAIDPSERKPIVLWIYSYGGDLDSTLSFLDACQLSKTPIITINAGVAMSAGLYILIAGHKRYCLPRARALIHSGSIGGMSGTYEQSEAVMADYKKSIASLQEYVLERTKIDPKLYAKKKAKEWYVDSAEQVSLGIVDGILTDFDAVM